MTIIYEADFRNKELKKVYDAEEERQRQLNKVTCAVCHEDYDKRDTLLIAADVKVYDHIYRVAVCEDCAEELHNIVQQNKTI